MDNQQQALLELGRALLESGYHFITPTPETHRRVRERDARAGQDRAKGLRDIFGYSRSFRVTDLAPKLWKLLEEGGGLQEMGDRAAGTVSSAVRLYQSGVRFSSLGSDLFMHSSFPTDQEDAVFFGPDTYRYARLLQQHVPSGGRIVDVGAGSGAGGLGVRSRASRLTLVDISARALRFAAVNATLAGAQCELLKSDILSAVSGDINVVISNPPYMRDPAGRAYRDGGGSFGEALAVRIVEESLARLAPGGTLVLYTGATIVDGVDTFWQRVEPVLEGTVKHIEYSELDPDVFGEELDEPGYADAERIAAVGLVVKT